MFIMVYSFKEKFKNQTSKMLKSNVFAFVTVLRMPFLSTRMSLHQNIFMKCLSLLSKDKAQDHRWPRSLDMLLCKTNKGQKIDLF